MNFNLNIHQVLDITIEPVREHRNTSDYYASRSIMVKTPEGTFEISLFSQHVSEDHDGELLQVKS